MGRYLKLLEEFRAKQAKEGATKVATKVMTEVGGQYVDTALVASVASVAGGLAPNEPKLGPDFGRSVKSEEIKKYNDINDVAHNPSCTQHNQDDGGATLVPSAGDKSDKSDKSPFWTAFVEFRDNSQNVALNHKYITTLADATIFLRDWGAQAEALNWSADDLFGLDPVAPLARYDAMGLVWMLNGQRVVALTSEAATIKTASGSLLKFYRRDISHHWAQRANAAAQQGD